MNMLRRAAALLMIVCCSVARGDGPEDNIPGNVRQIPPPGIEVPADDRARLQSGLDELAGRIEELLASDSADVQRLLPDVEVFHRAVDQALRFNEMFAPADIKRADDLLAEGSKRADALAKDDPYWTRQRGLVVRGFRSKLDDTVQPYGLVIPPTYRADIPYRYRTDLWFHGRGERSVELQFIHQRMRDPGEYQPEDTIVLHPFGRYSNAFKFAGEVDVFEALEHAKANYRIDDDRISVRGFSMGGAAAWHFAVHYADRWFAANPGAGFSETPLFLQTFQGEVLQPTWWEKTLWQWYDCPPWVTNFDHLPLIAYSGELDPQKQAGDVMANAYAERFGIDNREMELLHIVGPEAGHQIHPQSKLETEKRMTQLASKVQPPLPLRNMADAMTGMHFVTYTLRYHEHETVTINALAEHWRPAVIEVEWGLSSNRLMVNASNILDFTISLPPGSVTFDTWADDKAYLDVYVVGIPTTDFDEKLYKGMRGGTASGELPFSKSDFSWDCRVYFDQDRREWRYGTPPWENELRKRHGLQGPIDDALMDSFVFVKPTGECRYPLVQEWTTAELEHAITHWRQQMRGDARVKADADITDEDIAAHNLILWGDPASNSVLARIADQLPIVWGENEIIVGDRRFDAGHHAPILIYPNPLNPQKYVILNSSFTYREYDYLNNARQTPKLPDWAIVDLRVKPDSRWPGKIVDADFFDEKWQVQKPYRERMTK